MKLHLSDDERVALRRITIVMVAVYPVFVAICAALNLALAGILPGHFPAGWAEVFYGPAITLAVVWAALAAEVLIRLRLRQR